MSYTPKESQVESYAASPSEKMFWKAWKHNPKDSGLCLKYVFSLKGKLDITRIKRVLRHYILYIHRDCSSRFSFENSKLKKYLLPVPKEVIECVNITLSTKTLDEEIAHHLPVAFNLDSGPLYKFVYLKRSVKEHVLCLAFSHVIFDGTTYPKFRYFFEKEYATQKRRRQSKHIKREEPKNIDDSTIQFWKDFFEKSGTQTLRQPLRFFKKPNPMRHRFLKASITLSKETTVSIKNGAEEMGVTLFQFLASGWATLIGKYNSVEGTDSISLAYTVNVAPSKKSFGCHTNINPLIVTYSPTLTPRQIAEKVRRDRKEIKPHQHLPFAKICKLLNPKAHDNTSYNLLINHTPGLIGIQPPKLDKVETTLLQSTPTDGPYAFSLLYNILNTELHMELSVLEQLSSQEQLSALAKHFEQVLTFFSHYPDDPIQALSLKSPFEKLEGDRFNLPEEGNLRDFFEKALQNQGKKRALIFEENTLTYGELQKWVKRIAAHLKARASTLSAFDNTPLIGIHLERSHHMVPAVLSAIFADMCFVPLDPNYPLNRLEYMIQKSTLSAILTDENTFETSPLPKLLGDSVEFILLETLAKTEAPKKKGEHKLPGTAPQYILFTSGSTGLPKGVVIGKHNLLNFLVSMQRLNFCHHDDHLLALTSLNFDISLLELLLPLTCGATVEIVSTPILNHSRKLIEKIEKSRATLIQATPSTWRMVIDAGWNPKSPLKLLIGGEPLEENLSKNLLKAGHKLHHMYGPTETTIWSSAHPLTSSMEISVGHPIGNTELYVLDATHRPALPGAPGELWIGGAGVGLGYLGDSDNTDFRTTPEGKRLYRTGDIASYFGNNELNYMGRVDNRVKVRGLRIELDEISSIINQTPAVTHSVTVLRRHPEPHLVSYIQTDNPNIDLDTITHSLSAKLPSYMIPQRLITLREFPLTPNQKIDTKRLIAEEFTSLTPSKIERPKVPTDSLKHLINLFDEHFAITIKENQHNLPLGHFGLNSLSFNRLATLIEKHFSIPFDTHLCYTLNTINKLCTHLDRKRPKTAVIRTKRNHSSKNVAVIGMAAMLPKSADLSQFWTGLLEGRNAIDTPKKRPYLPETVRGGFIDDVDHFDPLFFNISPLEAMHMDPQQRLLLQTTWNALEDAGYNPHHLEGANVGVYAAVTGADYNTLQQRSANFRTLPYTLPGYTHSMLSNRLSYFFNWHGPSLTIDTACSGSLIALVRATNDLLSGIVDYAVVCSANTTLDHAVFKALQAGNFLSPSHRCATFDAGADGYVRGEGVGSILLRRADDALKEGDHCYGLIVASAVNHGGRANSLTAPNPEAQSALLKEVYQGHDLARQVSYIETHGTGTKLGDPIEIEALKTTWSDLGALDIPHTIAIGSVKTHIGHLEPLAGLASLLKVLLCLKHKTLPSNLHFEKLNPYIKLENTPFDIVTENRPWECPGPLIAGVSSFGFGGANAHVVVKEAPKGQRTKTPQKTGYLVTLSAKTESALNKRVENLSQFLEKHTPPLADLAYTLNRGRAHFEYRLARVVRSLEELKQGLKHPLHHATEKKKGDLQQLSLWQAAYLKGDEIPWDLVHENKAPVRIPLPTYPFDTKAYWFEENHPPKNVQHKEEKMKFEMISDVSCRVKISGNHVWFQDHIVSGHPMLPGVAHLTLALDTARQLNLLPHVAGLTSVHWLKAIICEGETAELTITFEKNDKGASYRIQHLGALCSEGILLTEKASSAPHKYETHATLNHAYDHDALYTAFTKNGIAYGPFFKVLRKIETDGTTHCIGEIHASTFIDPIKTNLLDAAFQSILGLSLTELSDPLLPFSLGYLELSKDYLTHPRGPFVVHTQKVSPIRVNLTIVDNANNILLSIHNLGVRPMKRHKLTYKPHWQESLLTLPHQTEQKPLLLVSSSPNSSWAQQCKKGLGPIETVSIKEHRLPEKLAAFATKHQATTEIWFLDDDDHTQLNNKTLYPKTNRFLKLLQELIKFPQLTLKVIARNALTIDEFNPSVSPQNTLWMGLAQTVAKEMPRWHVCCITTDHLSPEHLKMIQNETNANNPNNEPIVISKGKRYTRHLKEHTLPTPQQSAFKKGGAYLIIGGLGGIGFELSKHLAANYHAKLFLLGRREAPAEKLDELKRLGSEVVYERVDLTDAENLESVIRRHPSIQGIIHSALTLKDKTIPFLDEQALFDVLDPKVRGSINLMRALTKHPLPLDFILFFSSIQSFIANPGQGNYTAACVFKDSLSNLMRNLHMYNTKVINWGYWGSVGIVATPTYRRRMEKLGIGSIEPREGIAIIESLLASAQVTQIAVIKGSEEALRRLHVETQPNTLDAIIPTYDPEHNSVKRNRRSQEALEHYSRYAITKVAIPDNVSDKYNRLVQAIRNIPKVTPIKREDIITEFPALTPHIKLLDHCLKHYPDVLSGKVEHMSILFPDGTFDMVEPIYRNNPISDYYNSIVAKIAYNYLTTKSETGHKIIEIGAGTGSTTAFVLPELKGIDHEYMYTDISFAFLKKAQKEFAANNNLVYKIYNAEKEPTTDLEGNFDVVIATNVLHATSDLKATLKNVYTLLKENGILILNEVTSRQDYATLTFGLTQGWWLFQDHRIPDSPLLTGETWHALLKECDFEQVKSHGDQGQQVIVARRKIPAQKNTPSSTPELPTQAPTPNKTTTDDLEKFIIDAIATVMKIPKQSVKLDAPFSSFGIDSLIVLELLKPFKEAFGDLPSTLFFEYPTITKLKNHFIKEHSETIQKHFTQKENHSTSYSDFLKETIEEVMKLEKGTIQDDVAFQEYAIDSLITLEILKPLSKKFGDLPSTLLFEYPTIRALNNYLIEHHAGATIEKTPQSSPLLREDDIAIVGMAGTFPKAADLEAFRENLYKGKNCITPIPPERWDAESFYDETLPAPGKMYTKYGAFLSDIDTFDHEFFNITPFDAQNIDPGERLFLQNTHHALEDAGYPPSTLAGKEVGVFVGTMNGGYGWLGVDTEKLNWADSLYWSIANRTSYFFDWSGPSLAIDSACSSSLSALHLACQSLKNGDCTIAVVGGVNLIVHPRQYTKLCRLRMVSNGPNCKAFGQRADGFVDGEGIAALIIKRHTDALKDDDRIYAVIRSSAINAGGRSNGYTAPNPNAQAALISKALERASVPAESISYVEAHGTGTELGDPVEIRGLVKAYNSRKSQYCALGSVKSNIGHLESAAGLAGIIKVLLQLKHKQIAPTLHSQEENPHLKLTQTPFYLSKHLQEWTPPHGYPRRAAISSFGAGGANAHVILEEVPPGTTTLPNLPNYLIPLSAKSLIALHNQIDNIRLYLQNHPDTPLYALAYTLACTKEHYTYRVCFTVRTVDELRETLQKALTTLTTTNPSERGSLYTKGGTIDWSTLYTVRAPLSIPGYPFEKNSHWIDEPKHGLTQKQRYFEDHKINGTPIVPAALSLALISQALPQATTLEDTYFIQAINSPDRLQVTISHDTFSLDTPESKGHIKGYFSTKSHPIQLPTNTNTFTKRLEKQPLYDTFTKKGYHYGSTYQKLRWVECGERHAVGAIEGPTISEYPLNPSIIDAALQVAICPIALQSLFAKDTLLIPYHLKSLHINTKGLKGLLYSHCTVDAISLEKEEVSYSIFITNHKREVLLHFNRMTSKLSKKERIAPKKEEPTKLKLYTF